MSEGIVVYMLYWLNYAIVKKKIICIVSCAYSEADFIPTSLYVWKYYNNEQSLSTDGIRDKRYINIGEKIIINIAFAYSTEILEEIFHLIVLTSRTLLIFDVFTAGIVAMIDFTGEFYKCILFFFNLLLQKLLYHLMLSTQTISFQLLFQPVSQLNHHIRLLLAVHSISY